MRKSNVAFTGPVLILASCSSFLTAFYSASLDLDYWERAQESGCGVRDIEWNFKCDMQMGFVVSTNGTNFPPLGFTKTIAFINSGIGGVEKEVDLRWK